MLPLIVFLSGATALKIIQPEKGESINFDTTGLVYDESCKGGGWNYKCWKKGGHSVDRPELQCDNYVHTGCPAFCAEHEHNCESGHVQYANTNCWSVISPICHGKQQSPINIDVSVVTPTSNPSQVVTWVADGNGANVGGTSSTVVVENNGHALQITFKTAAGVFNGGKIVWDSTDYELLQFHLHMPSEHTISGTAKAAEGHLVHRKVGSSGNNDLLVIAVLFNVVGTKDDPLLTAFGLDSVSTYPLTVDTFTLSALLAADATDDASGGGSITGQYWTYDGSLTTPPCTQSVRWVIMQAPRNMGVSQQTHFKSLFPNPANNRPTQDLNGRSVVENTAAGRGPVPVRDHCA